MLISVFTPAYKSNGDQPHCTDHENANTHSKTGVSKCLPGGFCVSPVLEQRRYDTAVNNYA
ncbi:hypothetical protein [Corynebacterium stationis]|uniref:hypothetical protein n=1 Tax=Corynebacterium stationis TaxID=1705 RepID=UPI001758989D|nr:hypothetical protein [Corynebacterium stationis]HHT58896.1 hypothetical protein [Corynebacterium stationis]